MWYHCKMNRHRSATCGRPGAADSPREQWWRGSRGDRAAPRVLLGILTTVLVTAGGTRPKAPSTASHFAARDPEALPAFPAFPASPAASEPVSHPFRLSVADAGIDGAVLHANIRFFWDDLQVAVMDHTSDMAFKLAETGKVDAIIERYINDMLVIKDGEAVLQGKVVARGIEEADLVDEVRWWYRLEYPLDESTERLHVQNRLLFNMFEDQLNLVHIKTRRGRERAYRFNRGRDNVTIRLN